MCPTPTPKVEVIVDHGVAAPFLKRNALPILKHVIGSTVHFGRWNNAFHSIMDSHENGHHVMRFIATSSIGGIHFTVSIDHQTRHQKFLRITSINCSASPIQYCKSLDNIKKITLHVSPAYWDTLYTINNSLLISRVTNGIRDLHEGGRGWWVIKKTDGNYRALETSRFNVWLDIGVSEKDAFVTNFGGLAPLINISDLTIN